MTVLIEIIQTAKKTRRIEVIVPDISSIAEIRPVIDAEQTLNRFFEPSGLRFLISGK